MADEQATSWAMALKMMRRMVRDNAEFIVEQSIKRAMEGDLVALALIAAHLESDQRVRRSQSLRQRLIQQFDHTCLHCGHRGTQRRGPDGLHWHLDHLIPLGQGGSDDEANLVLSCATCNQAKGSSVCYGSEEAKTDGKQTAERPICAGQ